MTTPASARLRDLLPGITDRERAEPEAYPEASIRALYEAGIVAGPFPEHLGGCGMDLAEAVTAIETLAAASPSCALIAAMPLGLAQVLALGPDAASELERETCANQLERIAADYRQQRVYAACNSEKGAGGSLAATRTVATRSDAGAPFEVSGEKILASAGRFASVFFSTAKISQEDLAGAGVVEFFLVDAAAPGVEVLDDWDGFGMRATESHTVRYTSAPSREIVGFAGFIERLQPLQAWFCLFAAIPLGCARAILRAAGTPTPQSPALRLRLAEATMRFEAMRAYLLETARAFRPSAGPAYAARALRTKTYVAQEATRLCAELFALSGGRNYRRESPMARALADSFAGTSLRPPLALALDALVEQFSVADLID